MHTNRKNQTDTFRARVAELLNSGASKKHYTATLQSMETLWAFKRGLSCTNTICTLGRVLASKTLTRNKLSGKLCTCRRSHHARVLTTLTSFRRKGLHSRNVLRNSIHKHYVKSEFHKSTMLNQFLSVMKKSTLLQPLPAESRRGGTYRVMQMRCSTRLDNNIRTQQFPPMFHTHAWRPIEWRRTEKSKLKAFGKHMKHSVEREFQRRAIEKRKSELPKYYKWGIIKEGCFDQSLWSAPCTPFLSIS